MLFRSGAEPEAWLDSGQCIDCFLPPFNHRPQTSVQYGLALTHVDPAKGQTRFRWGFIGASDNHRARPGTGYKPVDRRRNTESAGPVDETWRRRLLGPVQPQDAAARAIPRAELQAMPGFQQTEFERQGSF